MDEYSRHEQSFKLQSSGPEREEVKFKGQLFTYPLQQSSMRRKTGTRWRISVGIKNVEREYRKFYPHTNIHSMRWYCFEEEANSMRDASNTCFGTLFSKMLLFYTFFCFISFFISKPKYFFPQNCPKMMTIVQALHREKINLFRQPVKLYHRRRTSSRMLEFHPVAV